MAADDSRLVLDEQEKQNVWYAQNASCCRRWRSRQQTRVAVFVAIQEMLENLPQKYSGDDYCVKCEAIYQHVYDSHFGVGRRGDAAG